MNSLSENINNEKPLLTSTSCFYKVYSVGKALKKANAYKPKGTPDKYLFRLKY